MSVRWMLTAGIFCLSLLTGCKQNAVISQTESVQVTYATTTIMTMPEMKRDFPDETKDTEPVADNTGSVMEKTNPNKYESVEQSVTEETEPEETETESNEIIRDDEDTPDIVIATPEPQYAFAGGENELRERDLD